jgi:hypothetical protein
MKRITSFILILILCLGVSYSHAAYPTTTEHHKVYPHTSLMASPYSGDPTGTIDCAAALESIKANQSNTGTINIPKGIFKISTSVTIPIGMRLQFESGSSFSIDAGKILTIQCPIVSYPSENHFSGAGSVSIGTSFSVSSVELIPPITTIAITTNTTIPSNVSLSIKKGTIFSIANGITLTINGTLDAGLYQIFSCTGTGAVDLSNAGINKAPVEWFGALGSGADDSIAIQKCITAVGAGPIAALSGKTYKCNAGLTLTGAETKLIGTNLTFISAGSELDFTDLASGYGITVTGLNCNVEGMKIIGGDNVTTDGGIFINGNVGAYTSVKNLYIAHFAKSGFKALYNKASMTVWEDIVVSVIPHGFGFYSAGTPMTAVELRRVTFDSVEFGAYLDSYNIKTTFKDCIWDSVVIALYAQLVAVQLENCHIEDASTDGVQTSTLATTLAGGAIDTPFYIYNGAFHIKGMYFGTAAGTIPRYFHLDSSATSYGTGALLELTDCRFANTVDYPNIVKVTGSFSRASIINSTGLSESTIRRNFQYGLVNDIRPSVSSYYAANVAKAGLYLGGRYITSSDGIPAANSGNWMKGDRIFAPYTAANQYGAEKVCVSSGSLPYTNPTTTGNTDGTTAVITAISPNNFTLGQFVTVSVGMPSATAPYMVIDKTASTITLDTSSNSAQTGVTIAPATPVFAYVGQPFFTTTYQWAIGSVAAGATALSADITVTGAALGDFVSVAIPADMVGVMATGYVKAANTVKIVVYNPTGSAWAPGTLYWTITVSAWRR